MNHATHHTAPAAPVEAAPAFRVLDACHHQTLEALTTLRELVVRLDGAGIDSTARAMAARVAHHFGSINRLHHEDEERHVFPRLGDSADPEIRQAVLRLQTDHDWLEEDWMELSPSIEAIAAGHPWYDLEVLREAVAIFCALSEDHIALEEAVIYPEARAQLRAKEGREMGREMSARRRAARAARR
jgi:hemerythrin-like domain-containing protein